MFLIIPNEKEFEEALNLPYSKIFIYYTSDNEDLKEIYHRLMALDAITPHVNSYFIDINKINVKKFGINIKTNPTFIKYLGSTKTAIVKGCNMDFIPGLYC